MDKVVLCIAHKSPELINALIQQLLVDASGCTDIYLHIDKKSDNIKSKIIEHPNVHFIQNNHSITWGDESNVEMLVDCFREIVSHGKHYDYFQICTGQDLMIRPGLDRFLENNKGKIYISIQKNDNYIKNLVTHYYPRCFRKDLTGNPFLSVLELAYTLLTRTGIVPRKKIDYDVDRVDFYHSYNWSFMPYETLCYIDRFLGENPGFMTIYQNCRLPEDAFLGTLIRNSPYRDCVAFREGSQRGNSLTYRRPIKGYHIPVLTMKDVPEIDKSENYMGRKFDMDVDSEIVELLKRRVCGENTITSRES